MKNRYFIFIIVLLASLGSAFWLKQKYQPAKEKPAESIGTDTGFFASVPIHSFSAANIPCINIQIEDKTYLVKIDLGFSGDLTVFNPILKEFHNKEFIKIIGVNGIQGKRYEKKIYRMSSLSIQHLTFSPIILEEEHEELVKESMLVKRHDKESHSIAGYLGWKLFMNSCLYLDVKNNLFIICDSIDTFEKEHSSLESYSQVPLLLNQGLLELNTLTSAGPLRCCLDTGCTLNLIKDESKDIVSVEERMFNEKYSINLNEFKIGNKNFGPLSFRPLPLNFPIHIEALLGMEFLINHRVFIDFVNEHIYFAPSL